MSAAILLVIATLTGFADSQKKANAHVLQVISTYKRRAKTMRKEVNSRDELLKMIEEQNSIIESQDLELARLKAEALRRYGSIMYISSFNDEK